jgi:imidazolonepropionase-like amidohydrolase
MVSKGGMSPRDALIAATKGGADLLDLLERDRNARSGKSADLIAVEGDPLVDPTRSPRRLCHGRRQSDPDERRQ